MNKHIILFEKEVQNFKNWLNGNLNYYLTNSSKSNGDAYKHYDKLIMHTQYAINALNEKNEFIVSDILYVLAIDNETENILSYIINCCTEDQIDLIVSNGYKHDLPDVRWQTAVIIKNRFLPKYEKYLSILKNDNDAYVRKRADNV